uniref:B30.2/SPRY domain-containing protein n=1 Tax=Globodera pallida TaxID=36090 RepID=A0A183BN51_GLOPA
MCFLVQIGIFCRDLAHRNAAAKEMFQKMSIVEGFSYGKCCDQKEHGRQLGELFDFALQNLNGPSRLVQERSYRMGEQHFTVFGSTNEAHLWDDLGESISHALAKTEPVRGKREAFRAWITLTNFLVESMRTGYTQQFKRRSLQRNSSSSQMVVHFFFDVSLSRLTPASFAAFHNLEEIFLDNASVLEHVDSRAFSGLKKLRKISISNCPALVSWTGVLLRENPQIQTLMVLNSGLRELPQLEMGPQHSLPMERIDFSGNCISQIAAGTLHAVQAKTVSFSNNAPCLRAIAANAFPACKFVELSSTDDSRANILAERKLSSDSLAFRKSVKPKVPTPYTQLRRKSQPDPLRAKISSPPQMSDISESSTASMCSSVLKSVGGVGAVSATAAAAAAVQQAEAKTKKGGGDGTNGKKMVHKRAKQVTSIEESAVVAAGAAAAARNGTEKRQSNASSAADGDSGRGDSLRSWASRQSGRPSVVTMCWEQPRDGTKQSQHQLLLRLATTQPSRSKQKVKELETGHHVLEGKVVKLEEYQKEMLLRMDELNRQQTMNSPTLSASFDLVALNETEDKATDAEQLLLPEAPQANGVTEMKYRKLLIDNNALQAEIAEIKRRLIPQQNRWDSAARHWELAIIEPDRLIVLHNGGGSSGSRSVFGVEPIPKENVGGIFYYEVKILEQKNRLHIGLGDKQMRPGKWLGFDEGTYAYYTNGTFWGHDEIEGCSNDVGRPYSGRGPKFEKGDVVGCGIDLATRQIIYTKNGQRLDTTGLFVSSAVELFASVTLYQPGDKIEANFGPNFKYIFDQTM